MKQYFFIKDEPANAISFYHLACFLIALPFDRFYSELILISFVLHTIIHLKKDRLKLVVSKEVGIVTAVYLAGLVSMLYSFHQKQAVNDIGVQLAILLFPVLLSVNELDLKKYKLPLLQIFGFTCILAIAYLYLDALLIIRYYHLPWSSLLSASFMNHNFSSPITMHATYLSMYVAFSICIFLFLYIKESSNSSRITYSGCILLLTAALLQLSTKSVSIALVAIIFGVFPPFFFDKRRKLLFLIYSVVGLVIIVFTIRHFDSFRERYISDFKRDLAGYTKKNETADPRIVRWKVAMELIKNSPVIGYGSGSEVALLKEKYFEKKLYFSYLNQFNAHNEYLSLLIKSGIPGLVVYLSVLGYSLFVAWKKRDLLFAAFLLLITITSVSENILDLNKGVFFYSFFFHVLFVE
jgi:O-antigen ligase